MSLLVFAAVAIIIFTTSCFCLISVVVGFRLANNQEIISDKTKNAIVHPIDTYQAKKEAEEKRKNEDRKATQDEVVLGNINTYDGYGFNQKSVPYIDEEEGDDF